ncbi:phage tail protein [Escherichia coli]|nr:phage tail protein [Escherichia coli]EFO0115283.1 phage tail protein [Escherichia coli]EFO0121404.1 phage tail protein [Escherichia coli]EFO0129842.1 phage tail protein [Escherichia coli]
MNDVTVVTSVTYPSPESLALVADVQYHEPYLSAALNRKFRGIVDPGFYAGFLPKPGGGMNLLITSVDGDKTAGAASVDIGEFYQVTIQHRKDISLALSAGKKYAIVLKGRYLLGEDTYQVNTASHIHAAEFVTRTYTDSYQLGDGELLVCTVNIPAGVSAITQEMIDTSERINRTIGIDISDSVTSSRSDVAASSLAVKKAYDLAKSKYTAQDASTTQKGLVQLSSETNSDSETMAATPKAVKSVKDLADTKAPIESPSLTGTPSAPTAAQGTNSTQIANTAFVKAAITALINGAPGTLDTLKEIAAAINNDPNFSTTINNALALKAPLASPALTGIPTAPTAAQGTNNTQIATTAYVRAAISALVGSSPEALDTLNELAAALGNDPNFATTMTNALAGKQPLDATLTALAGLATGANKLPYFTGTDTVSQTDLTSVGRDILAKTSVLAVIQYLGLRELGTSGEKIPLLSTANTWSARQTFNGGISGALTGNADTATKLKTARKINNVSFDGSADITLTPANLGVTSLTFEKNNGEMPIDADLNTFGPVEAYLGVWSKATSTNATLEKNFPEDNAVGVLEVFAAGNFAGTQRFTTRDGNVYIRRLANKWNGSDGPWGIWRHTQSATRPLSTTIDLNTLGAAEHLGLWRNSSSAIASYERNYPEEGGFAQGTLEILEGGNYGRTQRYTTRRGNMYVRCLAASWDASNPQWEPWLRVGHQSESRYYDGDLNDVTSPGIYSVTGKASNGPILDGNGVTVLGILEVLRRFDGVNVWQRYTTAGTGTTLKGRTFERVFTGSSWSEWREVYTSYSLPLNLGIGGAVAKLTSLDWQTYDFVPGSLITVRLDNMTNIPDGMDWGVIDGNLINIAVGPSDDSGTGRSMHVWRSTVSKANYRFFMVRISGDPGSRTITTRRVPIIDEAQTWGAKQTFSAGLSGELSGNAATATKLKTARKINSVSFDGTSDINLTPEDIGALPITGGTLTGGLTAAGEIISKSANGLRIAYGNYGFFIRNDGSSTYFMLTASGDNLGTWNSLRPLTINNANGAVSIGNGLNVTGDITTSAWVYANRFSINSGSTSWIDMRNQNVIFGKNAVSTSSAQALLRQDHADRKFFIGGLGNSQFGFYMINNSRTANGTDGQAFLDSSGNFQCGGQIVPANYSNFDSRYALRTSYVSSVRMGAVASYSPPNNETTWTQNLGSGLVMTGIIVQETGKASADNIGGIYYRPVQYCINGTWYTAASV